ncbi:MAG: M15 family metallopeptidase [Candidatus Jacksonbacteria bacterium]|jgi:peptidoglycan LD-endopeptidase CwlK|nr:M15 family metallopeptidase [Candidatus Jacksonbacteria bacterium]
MPYFSKSSQRELDSIHPKLQLVVNELIKHVDFKVFEGLRSKDRQAHLVESGASKTMHSKHLKGYAVDLYLLPINWKNEERWTWFMGLVQGIGLALGVEITCGRDWRREWFVKDKNHTKRFRNGTYDFVHFELSKTEIQKIEQGEQND